MKRINWKKIDIITYSGEFMNDDCKAEIQKALDLLAYYEHIGTQEKVRYIRQRLEEKKNYVIR